MNTTSSTTPPLPKPTINHHPSITPSPSLPLAYPLHEEFAQRHAANESGRSAYTAVYGTKWEYGSSLAAHLRAYRSGERRHEVMTIMAKQLTDNDIVNLAAWFSSIRVEAQVPR